MIIKGSVRTGSRALARHLMNAHENEHVELVELNGFAGQSLTAALLEIDAISKATQAQKPMFSVSFNAPETELVSDEQYFDAFARVEEKLGLVGQPRAIVSHEKEGRRHFHVVWSRIDGEKFKAIELPHFKLKCTDISKQIYEMYGWKMPQGLIDHKLKQGVNLKTAEYIQLKRQDVDPEELRQHCIDAWATSDNLNSFKHALEERNLYLAKGDKRGFVVVDHNTKVYSLSRFSGIKVKELKQKLGLPDQLPSVGETEKRIASFVSKSMLSEIMRLKATHRDELQAIREKKALLVHIQKAERRELLDHQRVKRNLLSRHTKERLKSGVMRFFSRAANNKKLVRLLARKDFKRVSQKQAESRQMTIFRHNRERAELQKEIKRIKATQRDQRMVLAKELVAIRKGELSQVADSTQRNFQAQAKQIQERTSGKASEFNERVEPSQTAASSPRRYKRKEKKKWTSRFASRVQSRKLKRKIHNPRFLRFLRKQKPKPEYKQDFNAVTGKPKTIEQNKPKPVLVPRMD